MLASGKERNLKRSLLDGFELEIFNLVRDKATSKQWKEWLRSPLEHAAAKGDINLFAKLMNAGADGGAGWRGRHGRTLLGAAAYGKSEKIVAMLLKAGSKPDLDVTFGRDRETALHVAARRGAEKVSKALLLAGAKPSLRNLKTWSPLHLAVEGGHDSIVGDLLLKGANPDASLTVTQRTPLHQAAEKGHSVCASRLLLGGATKDSLDALHSTPLILAAHHNNLSVVEELMSAGVDCCIRDKYGWSALDVAAQRRHADVLRALLRNGCEANSTDADGLTALHVVAEGCEFSRDNDDEEDVIRVLLEAGADIEAKTNNSGCTPLFVATEEGSISTIRALLERGADVNAPNNKQITPLHGACVKSRVHTVELLLRWGADEVLSDMRGRTAVDWLERSEEDGDSEGVESKERRADNQHIRRMLARAPSDRSWRRRGWLVLWRSSPAKMQLTNDSGPSKKSFKAAKASGQRFDSGDEHAENLLMVNFGRVVDNVVKLDPEGVFRLIVGFL